ncbi:hypothetical protein [Epilithonimonas vandammei]|uniref:Uncharacterized protein n=1 Tax=Epilithonimonas vandammei TaxID=2487072 RepID=A0A3G8Y9F7_9FLAO|nr:hypothetical protein [Epilithonimonas vandammei]AZI39184.1 hypothetical protein EIB74_04065 [Epilithonimonas vandammei]
MEPDNGYDENGRKINDLGGDKTDYILRKNPFGGDGYQILDQIDVKHTYGPFGDSEGYGYRNHYVKQNLPSPALYDPSFDIMSNYVGGAVAGKALGVGLGYLSTSNKIGQLAFNSKYIGGSSKLFGRGYLGSFNGAKNGVFNRGTYRIGWSYYKGTHYFQPRIGPMFGAKHLTPWFQYRP